MEKNLELTKFKKKVREAVANYIVTEGCSCCASGEHPKMAEALGKLLNVKKFQDGSGYNFPQYKTPNK